MSYIAILLLLTGLAVTSATSPSLTIYQEKGHKGKSMTLNTSSRNLGDWAGVAESVCATGFWVMFSVSDFGEYSYAMWLLGAPNCVDLAPYSLDKTLKSARQVGSPDNVHGKTLSLFSAEFFAEDETFLTQDTPIIPNGGNFYSAVVEGDEPWSIYTEENYQGTSACLGVHPEYGPVYGWFQNPSEMGAVGGNVRSARKGCPSSVKPLVGQALTQAAHGL